MPSKYKNKSLRITGGIWSSCKINFADNPDIKPTTDFVRETLGNWLAPFINDNICCLDLFSGSGILAIELLSRGVKNAHFVDISRKNLLNIRANIDNLDQLRSMQCEFVKQDAFKYIAQIDQKFDVIFLDPPFNTNYLTKAAALISRHNIVDTNSLVYVERSRYQDFTPPTSWHLYKSKSKGGVVYQLWKCFE